MIRFPYGRFIAMCLLGMFFSIPFIWMVCVSFKPRAEVEQPAMLPENPTARNYPIELDLKPDPVNKRHLGMSFVRWYFNSITVALCASFISLLIGVPLGAIAGYFRGKVDEVIVWLYTTLGTIPYILLVMAFAVVLRERTIFGWQIKGATAVYLAIGLTSWVGICRLIRGEIIKRKESEYVLAARALGCSNGRIIFKHLLPNVFHIIIINFSLRFVSFIHAEVILSFLGLGETDRPSWGAMIDAARTELARNVWWEMAAATLAIFFISLALNIFGDALRDCLDPKLRTD